MIGLLELQADATMLGHRATVANALFEGMETRRV